jgi:hypothetical protein
MRLRATLFAFLFFVSSSVLGVSEEDIGFATASSIPPHVMVAFAKFPLSNKYTFLTHVNPFYVQGDFNGDGKLDAAILIKEKTTGKSGIAIVHGGSTAVRVLGAGRAFGNGGDDFYWLDAWYSYPRGKVGQGAEEGAPPKLVGDAIMVIKTESASALVYWAGSQYRWYQQGD